MSDDDDAPLSVNPGVIIAGKYRVEKVIGQGGHGRGHQGRARSVGRSSC
jgi:hypothetical protein